MPTIINRNMYTQINHDSGSLTDAFTLVHQFAEPGEYHGLLLNSHGDVIRAFTISVSEGASAPARQENERSSTHGEVPNTVWAILFLTRSTTKTLQCCSN